MGAAINQDTSANRVLGLLIPTITALYGRAYYGQAKLTRIVVRKREDLIDGHRSGFLFKTAAADTFT